MTIRRMGGRLEVTATSVAGLLSGVTLYSFAWFWHKGFVLGAPSVNVSAMPPAWLRRLVRRGDGPINLVALWGELWGLAAIALGSVDALGLLTGAVVRDLTTVVINGGGLVAFAICLWILVRQRCRMG